jgi:hypothetical protein
MVFSGEIGVDNGFWYTQIQKMRKIVKHAKKCPFIVNYLFLQLFYRSTAKHLIR